LSRICRYRIPIHRSEQQPFQIYARVAETGIPERFEINFTPLDIWLNISVYSQQKGYFIAVFDNVSERKRADEEIKEANQSLKLALEAGQAGTWELDQAGETKFVVILPVDRKAITCAASRSQPKIKPGNLRLTKRRMHLTLRPRQG
jgi:hypothetical protein